MVVGLIEYGGVIGGGTSHVVEVVSGVVLVEDGGVVESGGHPHANLGDLPVSALRADHIP